MFLSAVEKLSPECYVQFTDSHLAMVLHKCFKRPELDDHIVQDEGDTGDQKLPRTRKVKGLVSRCLDRDDIAFAKLKNTKARPKEFRLKVLSECRPEDCSNAVELFLWLIKVKPWLLSIL